MLLEQDTFPAWEKSSCQLQPPVPPHTSTGGPLGPSPPQKAAALLAGSSTCMDAQRSYELHRVTNLPWLEVQVGKMKSSSIERDAMGVQMPSLPQRGLPWIIRPSTPVEELAPSGTGIISLQCAAQESVIHPLKYLVTANHNTASWWKMPLLSMKWSTLPSKQKTPRAHKRFSYQKHFSSFCHHYKSKTSDFLLEQSNIGAQSTNHTVKLTVFRKQNCESFGQQFPIKEIK